MSSKIVHCFGEYDENIQVALCRLKESEQVAIRTREDFDYYIENKIPGIVICSECKSKLTPKQESKSRHIIIFRKKISRQERMKAKEEEREIKENTFHILKEGNDTSYKAFCGISIDGNESEIFSTMTFKEFIIQETHCGRCKNYFQKKIN